MPRQYTSSSTNEKLKRTKLAREQLQLEQEQAAWFKSCKPDYPRTPDWQLRQNDYYEELLKDLNNAKYQTLIFELRSLIVTQKKKRKAAEGRAHDKEGHSGQKKTVRPVNNGRELSLQIAANG